MPWTTQDVPSQIDKTVIITGANSGLGYWTAFYLAKNGANIIMACRNTKKAEVAKEQITSKLPSAQVQLSALDLSNLDSIKRFAEEFQTSNDKLNILVNNAGVMALPYCKTHDGFEMQLGTNHLGHFTLTGLLLPTLLKTPDSRIVNTSSAAHRAGKISFSNLMGEKHYNKWQAYAQSKLANLFFTFELQRRLAAAQSSTISLAAHPGYAATNLQSVGPTMANSILAKAIMWFGNTFLAQSAEMGALPQLYAATAIEARAGSYIGPDGLFKMRGYPTIEKPRSTTNNIEIAEKLWQVSEELTGIRYTFA